jgi:hypothetical protein
MSGQFTYAAIKALTPTSEDSYYASRDANGNPFPLYRQGAYMFTDYSPAGLRNSAYALQRNTPTNTVMANNAMQNDGVAQATLQNIAMVNRTQSLATNSYPIGCSSPNDDKQCNAEYPGSKCVAVHMDWNDAKGNQTNFCSHTVYPEMKNGVYSRLDSSRGGIGKSCNNNSDCGNGYVCNNQTNIFGKNRQATGYCSQQYTCPNGSVQMSGYPYNSSEPIPPPPDQNNYGRGYSSKDECKNNLRGYQDCVQNNQGNWFAVFAQYCPVTPSLRKNSNPQGAFSTTPPSQQQIIMPGWGNQMASGFSSAPQAFASWNINSSSSKYNEDQSPLAYSLSINPRPN